MNHHETSDELITKWQRTIDLMADILEVPAGLIMRIQGLELEVFVASRSAGNPYEPGQREHFAGSGLYCEHVINTREKLLVRDATADPDWNSNPDIKQGMISYLGFPILLPTGEVFGTICILDNKANAYGERYERLMLEFKELIESHLALLERNGDLERLNQELNRRFSEIKALRGIIPICMVCKKVRNDEGFWQAVEVYVHKYAGADFSHGICPDCLEEHYPAIGKKEGDPGRRESDAGG